MDVYPEKCPWQVLSAHIASDWGVMSLRLEKEYKGVLLGLVMF